ncbi:MAG: DUF3568 family protein [Planctomycetota bacterium]
MRTFLLIGTILSCIGCFARGGVYGELRENLDASVQEVHEAVTATLRAQDLAIEEESVDQQTSLVKGRFADGVQVNLHTERFTDRASRLTIQVGTFGDGKRSQALLEGIEKRLPAGED